MKKKVQDHIIKVLNGYQQWVNEPSGDAELEEAKQLNEEALQEIQNNADEPLIQNNFKCPNCEIGMEYRVSEEDPSRSVYPLQPITYMWACPECPIICFEYYTHQDIEVLKTLIK
jgi:hypothetical protein